MPHEDEDHEELGRRCHCAYIVRLFVGRVETFYPTIPNVQTAYASARQFKSQWNGEGHEVQESYKQTLCPTIFHFLPSQQTTKVMKDVRTLILQGAANSHLNLANNKHKYHCPLSGI